MVDKFSPDGSFERSWPLPPEVIKPLQEHVEISREGWVMDLWVVTPEIAAIVQPWVDEPIDVTTNEWVIGSWQAC